MLLTINMYYVRIALLSYIIFTWHFKCWIITKTSALQSNKSVS